MNAVVKPSKISQAFKWWKILLVLMVFVVAVFVLLQALERAPKRPLMLDKTDLTHAQINSVQSAIEPLGDMQFFTADLAGVHRAVSALSWVEHASVRRDWQQGIVVSVLPRRAVANFGSQYLLDANGKVYVPADERELMNKTLVNLYSSHATDASDMMKQMRRVNEWFTPLGMTAQDVTLTSRRTWLIRFSNGLRVVVDHENTEQKLYSLSSLLQGKLAKDLPKMQSVDLRYKNGFAIAWKRAVIDEASANSTEKTAS